MMLFFLLFPSFHLLNEIHSFTHSFSCFILVRVAVNPEPGNIRYMVGTTPPIGPQSIRYSHLQTLFTLGFKTQLG